MNQGFDRAQTKQRSDFNSINNLPVIYILEDEDFLRSSLKKYLSKIYKNYIVKDFACPSFFVKELSLVDKNSPLLLVTDMSFGENEIDGIALIDYLKKLQFLNFEVIMMTGFGSIETAINATKRGIYKYLTKPFSLEDIKGVISECLLSFQEGNKRRGEIKPDKLVGNDIAQKKLVSYEDLPQCSDNETFFGIIGRTPLMSELYTQVRKVSKSNSTVLILGESGTGKELVAKSIHALSNRKNGPLININCGAIPSEILESELFGHQKGAFTGAVSNRVGKFEASNDGSILLDEIGDMPLLLQVKLLRVLQTKTIEPVGANFSKKINTRVIAATHKDIVQLVDEGKFREDLFYRLNVIPIRIPSLKERAADIPLLLSFFIKKFTSGNKTNLISFTQSAYDKLIKYDWPGNVRELENLVERLIILKGGNIVEVCDLPKQIQDVNTKNNLETFGKLPREGLNLKDHLLQIEKSFIEQALRSTRGNKNQASKLLGLNRTTLIEKLKKIDIDSTVDR